MNTHASAAPAGRARIRSAGPRLRALAGALVLMPAIAQVPAAGAMPHRDPVVDDCVRAAVAQMGVGLERRIEGSVRVHDEPTAGQRVYLDVVSTTTRLPLRLRLYCSVNEQGVLEHVLSTPRLGRAG